MPADPPNIPPELIEKLSKLDPSNPKDLEQLFALEAELGALAGIEVEAPDPRSPLPPEEDPSLAYLAAADPKISLEEFIEIIDGDVHQIVNTQTLLYPACITNSLEKATWLVEQGLDPDHADQSGYSPLIYACLPGRNANLELIRFLLDRKPNVNAHSVHLESPLSLLIRDGNYEGVQLLLNAGAESNQANFTPLHQAAATGAPPKILSFLTPQTLEEKNCFERTPWLTAIHADQLAAAQLLQSQGANIKALGQSEVTALHLAAESNACNSIHYLLSLGHQIDGRAAFGNTPLHNAVETDSFEAAELLLNTGADVHALTETIDAPISYADSLPMLRLLQSHGANLNHLNGQSLTPLHYLAECEDIEAVQWLLDHGADLSLLPEDSRAQIQTLLTT